MILKKIAYYSFGRQFRNAEKAFQESNECMELEDCVEIKLHRLLWYAEHKTRVRDEEEFRMLMSQAHEVFMKDESPSEFILVHFPDRFRYLCMAASRRVSIDEVLNETLDDGAFERHQDSSRSASFRHTAITESPRSAPSTPIPSVERLFPLTPRGFNSAIDADSWRQFVTFPPTADSLQSVHSPSTAQQ